MSKKHFIELADVIREHRSAFSDEAIEALARFCYEQNSSFMKARWMGYINGDNGPNGGKV